MFRLLAREKKRARAATTRERPTGDDDVRATRGRGRGHSDGRRRISREVGEAGGGGEGELDHHVVGMMDGGIGEDEVGGSGDENAWEEEGPDEHYVPSVELVDEHSPEAGSKAHELVTNAGEAACVRRPAR
ncbi:hypothetical protein B296_00025849 [Ensete ventricosum]|uniref:Uncharacterized protein n=1 Tax=Ensete ventricosum TaxID=4639 RepID=A0A426Z3A4_ENSVE|nr:hypothetical protein B296_00025849 [Ensete ventricosum]